jgi:hypothetical protein
VRRSVLLTPLGWAFAAIGTHFAHQEVMYIGFGVFHGE